MADTAGRRRRRCPCKFGDGVAVPGDFFFSSAGRCPPPAVGRVVRVLGNRVEVRWKCDDTLSKVGVEDLIPVPPPPSVPLPVRGPRPWH